MSLVISALYATPMWMSLSSASAWSTLSPSIMSPLNGSHRSEQETKLLRLFWWELSRTFAIMWMSLFTWISFLEPNRCAPAKPGGWPTESELRTTLSAQPWHSTTSRKCLTLLYLLLSSTSTLVEQNPKSSAHWSAWRFFVILVGGKSSTLSNGERLKFSHILSVCLCVLKDKMHFITVIILFLCKYGLSNKTTIEGH